MFGAACKGLHCAGCGKGIPLGIVIILVGIATRISNAMVQEVANALMVFALIIGGCMIATGAIIAVIQRVDFQMDYSKWDAPTYVQQKRELEWAERAVIGAYDFTDAETEAIPVRADTWTK